MRLFKICLIACVRARICVFCVRVSARAPQMRTFELRFYSSTHVNAVTGARVTTVLCADVWSRV